MDKLPADWAIQQAINQSYPNWKIENVKKCASGYVSLILAARLIEKYEQPPIDPDVSAVRAILCAYWETQGCSITAKEYEIGIRDATPRFEAVVREYRRVKTQK